MTIENFIDEFKTLANTQCYLKKIAEKIKSHQLPVIIFGAAGLSRWVFYELKNLGIKVEGYAVDEKYYMPNQTYSGLPIFNFDELRKTPEKYVFVLGIGVTAGKRVAEFLNDEKIISYKLILETVEPISYEYIFDNQNKFFETYNLLDDELSKNTMMNYLKAHITEDRRYLESICVPNEYFNELTKSVAVQSDGGYLDCGAYIGDTVKDFVEFTQGNYSRIFAIEPESKNFDKLKKFVREKNYPRVELFNCGVWNEKCTLAFADKNIGSKIMEDGGIKVSTDTVDNIVGAEPISLIKMDIEGAELKALEGSLKTLKNSRPILTLSAYHRKEDLITLPQFIKNIYRDCRFYLRKHEGFYALYGLDLYVVPERI